MPQIITGNGGVNRKTRQLTIGVGGVNRTVKEAFAGVSGVNRRVYSNSVKCRITGTGKTDQISTQLREYELSLGSNSKTENRQRAQLVFTFDAALSFVGKAADITYTRSGNTATEYNIVIGDESTHFGASNGTITRQISTRSSIVTTATIMLTALSIRDHNYNDSFRIVSGDFVLYPLEYPQGLPITFYSVTTAYNYAINLQVELECR